MREDILSEDPRLSPSDHLWIWTLEQDKLVEYLKHSQSTLEISILNQYTVLIKHVKNTFEFPDISIINLPERLVGKTIVKVIAIGEFTNLYGGIIYREQDDDVCYYIVEMIDTSIRVQFSSSELLIYA